ncbi:hypothetical protein HELRODRAFT_179572 [Helobdella robusta]|uniref:Uncharacterized protein n=1 Tax=Helobdella robusta TaxID=6412 RepID=T1FEW2_HELRO|nr:hypothetical protein HELRODRAFT_179572 [Helobdella robusta]ESN95236.1 hypothetical protein HELRODRAFT_179572 [Helobdella robusta]
MATSFICCNKCEAKCVLKQDRNTDVDRQNTTQYRVDTRPFIHTIEYTMWVAASWMDEWIPASDCKLCPILKVCLDSDLLDGLDIDLLKMYGVPYLSIKHFMIPNTPIMTTAIVTKLMMTMEKVVRECIGGSVGINFSL